MIWRDIQGPRILVTIPKLLSEFSRCQGEEQGIRSFTGRRLTWLPTDVQLNHRPTQPDQQILQLASIAHAQRLCQVVCPNGSWLSPAMTKSVSRAESPHEQLSPNGSWQSPTMTKSVNRAESPREQLLPPNNHVSSSIPHTTIIIPTTWGNVSSFILSFQLFQAFTVHLLPPPSLT